MVFWSVDWQGLIKLTLKLRHYSALVPRSWTLGQSPRRGGAGKGEGELYALHPSLRPLFWSPSDRYWEWLQCYDWGVFAIFLNYHEVLRYPLLNFDCTRSVRGKNLIATPLGCFFNTFFGSPWTYIQGDKLRWILTAEYCWPITKFSKLRCIRNVLESTTTSGFFL